MEELPDLNAQYSEGSFDKDVGYCSTEKTMRQDGARVCIETVYSENDVEQLRYESYGTLTRVYEDEGLAQITLDDGERTYFDLRARRLRPDAEHIMRLLKIDFDLSDEAQVRGLTGFAGRVARLIDPDFEIEFREEGSPRWGEEHYQYGDTQRYRLAHLGDANGHCFRLTRTEELEAGAGYRFGRLLIEALGLPDKTSVALILNSYGHHSLSVRAPLEKHTGILEVIEEQARGGAIAG